MSCPSSFSSVFFVVCFPFFSPSSMSLFSFFSFCLFWTGFGVFRKGRWDEAVGICGGKVRSEVHLCRLPRLLHHVGESLKNKGSIRNPRYGDSAISKFSLDPTFSAPYFYMVSAAADGGDVNCSIDENTDRTAVNSGPQSVVREKKAKRRLSEHAGHKTAALPVLSLSSLHQPPCRDSHELPRSAQKNKKAPFFPSSEAPVVAWDLEMLQRWSFFYV
ncbi:hypothetical protein MUK42_10502 [Musa troglodytarum]|uniref:Uncharacterized protein n=1 Tax=Musa troglodytarum TaxID=320322 RepID=A0A9E7KMQ4_9LILI|nr:hypothetical protein MUK42_10502 [Musa troglodytarum]